MSGDKLKWEEMAGLGSCSLSVSDVESGLQEEYGQNLFFQDNKQKDKWNNIKHSSKSFCIWYLLITA